MNEFEFKDLHVARTYWQRLKGLDGKTSLPEDFGLLFPNCHAIHMFGMKIPLDIIYLNFNNDVTGIETISPWSVGHAPTGTKHTLETAAGWAKVHSINVGDHLSNQWDTSK